MEIVIQNCKNWTYLVEGERWSLDISQAKRFSSSVDALEYARNGLFRNVQIVLKFEGTDLDVQLPVEGCGKQPQAAL
jgi:hypothetical protein